MEPKPIILKIILDNTDFFEMFLNDFFWRDKSPVFPICIMSRPYEAKRDWNYYDFRIIEVPVDPNEPDKKLAEIKTRLYPSFVLVFIEGKETNGDDWEKVEKIVQEIITKAKLMEFEITLFFPDGSIHQSADKPWEEVEDHYSDRAIVELWHKGAINSEIAKKVGLEPRSVTNILSKLRDKYGKVIVPTDDQRRKKLHDN